MNQISVPPIPTVSCQNPSWAPDNTFKPPPWYLKEIIIIAASPLFAPTKSSIRFDVSLETAEHNAVLLREIYYGFQHFFQAQAGSTLTFGSEFCPVEQLRPLLRTLPGFNELAEMFVTGMPYHYAREITEAKRDREVIAMLTRGNHQPRTNQL